MGEGPTLFPIKGTVELFDRVLSHATGVGAAARSLLNRFENFWYHASSSGVMLGPTRSKATSKSRRETSVASTSSLREFIAASRQIASMSAPEYP